MYKYEKPVAEIIDLTPAESMMLDVSGGLEDWEEDGEGTEEW